MADGPTKLATTIMVGDELFETNPITVMLEDMMRAAFIEMEMTRLHGPLLGPGPIELWRILEPQRRRQRLRNEALALMPGKRPGRFLRCG